MMIKIFVIVAALVLPNLAWAVTGTLPITITPSGGGLTAPAPAVAAGFTFPANVTDFTKALPTNWLGSCPSGPDGIFNQNDLDGTHRWWAGWGFFPQSYTCNKKPAGESGALSGAAAGGSFQDTDPVFGNLALHQTTNADVTTDGGYYWDSGAQMGTSPSISIAGDFTLVNGFNQHNDYPNGFYIEETYRLTPTNGISHGQPVGMFQGLNSWSTQGLWDQNLAGFEWDPGEMQTNFGGIDASTGGGFGGMDSAVHNWGTGTASFLWTSFGNGPPPFPPANMTTTFNFNIYNKVGMLVTSNGTTDMAVCTYFGPENGPVLPSSSTCPTMSSIGVSITAAQFAQRLAWELQTSCGPHGSGPVYSGLGVVNVAGASPCPPVGTHGDNYVKNIQIWSCPNFAAGDGHACDRALITTPPAYQ